jgi:hypothetical protein
MRQSSQVSGLQISGLQVSGWEQGIGEGHHNHNGDNPQPDDTNSRQSPYEASGI